MPYTGSAAREILMIQTESAFMTPSALCGGGVPLILGNVALPYPVTSTGYTLGTNYNAMFCRLDGGNAFTMRPMPQREEIMWGGGLAIPSQNVSGHFEMRGRFQTKLYASQAELLLSWAGKRFDGTSSPWAETGIPIGDLCSCTVYHGVQQDSTNYKWRVYCGCKIANWTVAISRDAQVATFSCDIVGCIPLGTGLLNLYGVDPPFISTLSYTGAQEAQPKGDISIVLPTNNEATTWYSPTDKHYPSDPYIFVHTAGNFQMYPYGVTPTHLWRTQYSSLTLTSANKIDLRGFESPWPTIAQFVGRSTTLAAKVFYKKNPNPGDSELYPDDRAQMEGVRNQVIQLTLKNGSGANNVTSLITLRSRNVITSVEDDLPLDRVHEQTVTATNILDTTTTSGWGDIDFTFTKS